MTDPAAAAFTEFLRGARADEPDDTEPTAADYAAFVRDHAASQPDARSAFAQFVNLPTEGEPSP
ncbi:MAG: hypothetical protein ABI808_11205 [Pseudonocardiales bacterium]